tara:strand:+ start:154 stop:594 length:441 start_codon:yes stop_codon:yes gene_type:complete
MVVSKTEASVFRDTLLFSLFATSFMARTGTRPFPTCLTVCYRAPSCRLFVGVTALTEVVWVEVAIGHAHAFTHTEAWFHDKATAVLIARPGRTIEVCFRGAINGDTEALPILAAIIVCARIAIIADSTVKLRYSIVAFALEAKPVL